MGHFHEKKNCMFTYISSEVFGFLLKRIQKVPIQKDNSVYENENANDAEKMQVFDNLKDKNRQFAIYKNKG